MKKLTLLGSLLTITACTNTALTPDTPSNLSEPQASVHSACSNLKSQYPLNLNSDKESTLEDFTAYFASGGVIDSYISTKAQQDDNKKQAKIISQIRRDLFDSTQTKLHAELTLKTLKASPQLSSATLQLGNQHGPAITGPRFWHQLTWPTAGPAAIDAYQLDGRNISTEFTGDWSLFKLLDTAEISKDPNGNVTLNLDLAPDRISIQYLATLPEVLVNWRELANQLDCSQL